VIAYAVECCQHCQRDLREVESLAVERRQVLDLPPKRVAVIGTLAQQTYCLACQQISSAPFSLDMRAPVQYDTALGAVTFIWWVPRLVLYKCASEVVEDLLCVR